jgi:hypothetical protein
MIVYIHVYIYICIYVFIFTYMYILCLYMYTSFCMHVTLYIYNECLLFQGVFERGECEVLIYSHVIVGKGNDLDL